MELSKLKFKAGKRRDSRSKQKSKKNRKITKCKSTLTRKKTQPRISFQASFSSKLTRTSAATK